MRDIASRFGLPGYRIAGPSPKAGNKVAPNVVTSLISPPSTRSTSILNARNGEAGLLQVEGLGAVHVGHRD